jgi:hypothetical protein
MRRVTLETYFIKPTSKSFWEDRTLYILLLWANGSLPHFNLGLMRSCTQQLMWKMDTRPLSDLNNLVKIGLFKINYIHVAATCFSSSARQESLH